MPNMGFHAGCRLRSWAAGTNRRGRRQESPMASPRRTDVQYQTRCAGPGSDWPSDGSNIIQRKPKRREMANQVLVLGRLSSLFAG